MSNESLKLNTIATYAITTLLGIGLAFLISNMALDKGISPFWRVFLIVSGIVMIMGFAFVQGLLPWKPKSEKLLNATRTSANSIVVMGNVASFMTAMLGLISPTSVVESAPGIIEAKVTSSNEKLEAISKELGVGENNNIIAEVNGIWGERGCAVTYEIAIKEKSLSMKSLKSESGMSPFLSVGTIIDTKPSKGENKNGITINTTTEEGDDRGKAIEFKYETNGTTKRLVRRDYSREIPLVLDYCGG